MRPPIPYLRVSRFPQRAYATSTSLYHRKVTAFKFAVSQEEATAYLQRAAVPYLAELRREEGFAGFIESLGIRWRSLTGETGDLSLEKLEPIYMPTWRLELEVQGDVLFEDKAEREALVIAEAYIPGNGMGQSTIAQLCLRYCPDLANIFQYPQPFSRSMLRQDGVMDNIFPIPYAVSPFALPSLLRSIPVEVAHFGDVTFYPPSLRFSTWVATPILQPIYLAQFRANDTNIVGVLDASWAFPKRAWFLRPKFAKVGHFEDYSWVPVIWKGLHEDVPTPARPRAPQPKDLRYLQKFWGRESTMVSGLQAAVKTWGESANWEDLEGMARVNDNMWNDSRIVSWNPDAICHRIQYFRLTREIQRRQNVAFQLSEALSVFERSHQVHRETLPKRMTDPAADLEKLRKERRALKAKLGLRGETLPPKQTSTPGRRAS